MRTCGCICLFFVPLSQRSVRYPADDLGLLSSATFRNRVLYISGLRTDSDWPIVDCFPFCEYQTFRPEAMVSAT